MSGSYLNWNFVNWITVVLMAALGMCLIGAVSSGLRLYGGKSMAASQ